MVVSALVCWTKRLSTAYRHISSSISPRTPSNSRRQADHYHWRKGFPYEFSSHVPLIVKWPSSLDTEITIPRGSTLSHVTELRDVFPTMLDAAGALGTIPTNYSMDGDSEYPIFSPHLDKHTTHYTHTSVLIPTFLADAHSSWVPPIFPLCQCKAENYKQKKTCRCAYALPPRMPYVAGAHRPPVPCEDPRRQLVPRRALAPVAGLGTW